MKITREGELLIWKIMFIFLLAVILASAAWGIHELMKAGQTSIPSAFSIIEMPQS